MDIRTAAQYAYFHGSQPVRSFVRWQLARLKMMPLGVLFYHRIADTDANAWTMTNATFQRQMNWLKQNVELVSLAEIQRRIRSGRNERVAIAVTFDDGYAENCDQAIPFLVEQNIPTTYFVSLDHIQNERPFPHDVENGRVLPPNTSHQVREMAAAGIEIGAHTRTHCDIGAITDADRLNDEVVVATDELGGLIGSPVRYFAFPFGMPKNLSHAAARLAETNGFAGVCSAFGAYNFPDQDPFHLRRFHADPEFIRFLNWTTVDPRKLRHYRDFEFPESAIAVERLAEPKANTDEIETLIETTPS